MPRVYPDEVRVRAGAMLRPGQTVTKTAEDPGSPILVCMAG